MLVGVSRRVSFPMGADEGQAPSASQYRDTGRDPLNEWTFLFGRTILNSFESESTSFMESSLVGYRRRVARHVDVSLSYCDEGGLGPVKRDGLALQGWVMTRPFQGQWLLGFGMGPYFNRLFPDRNAASASATANFRTNALYSMVVGRHLWRHWAGRLQWNRTLTRNNRDTDALLTGLAYQW
jgi:hypothetical protein